MSGDLKIAAEFLEEEGQTLVVVKNGRLLFSSRLAGIQPLLDALDNNVLPGSAVADKITGRAAAMVLALGQVTALHSLVMSQGASEVLADNGILYCAAQVVPQIKNREGTGPCPFEAITEFTVIPEKGVNAVRKLLKDLHSAAPGKKVH